MIGLIWQIRHRPTPLSRHNRTEGQFVLRFLAGGFDPAPLEPPVFIVTVTAPSNRESTAEVIERVRAVDEWAYVSVVSDTEVHIQSDYGEELSVHGATVTRQAAQYAPADFERLARHNYAWGEDQHRSLREHMKCLHDLRALIRQQHVRVSTKAAGHDVGTTARTLYEQQLSFLARLLRELEV